MKIRIKAPGYRITVQKDARAINRYLEKESNNSI
jgi:hypothetical protein